MILIKRDLIYLVFSLNNEIFFIWLIKHIIYSYIHSVSTQVQLYKNWNKISFRPQYARIRAPKMHTIVELTPLNSPHNFQSRPLKRNCFSSNWMLWNCTCMHITKCNMCANGTLAAVMSRNMSSTLALLDNISDFFLLSGKLYSDDSSPPRWISMT